MPTLYLRQKIADIKIDELDQAAYDRIVAAGDTIRDHKRGPPIITLR